MVRYAVLYFVLFVVFLALTVAPSVLKTTLSGVVDTLATNMPDDFPLVQPMFQNNNDTRGTQETGTAAESYSFPPGYQTGSASASASS